MSYRLAKTLWACLVAMSGAMTLLGMLGVAEKRWPTTASPIALICALITGWAMFVGRERFDEGRASDNGSAKPPNQQ